jgi:hypothetical protein
VVVHGNIDRRAAPEDQAAERAASTRRSTSRNHAQYKPVAIE